MSRYRQASEMNPWTPLWLEVGEMQCDQQNRLKWRSRRPLLKQVGHTSESAQGWDIYLLFCWGSGVEDGVGRGERGCGESCQTPCGANSKARANGPTEHATCHQHGNLPISLWGSENDLERKHVQLWEFVLCTDPHTSLLITHFLCSSLSCPLKTMM